MLALVVEVDGTMASLCCVGTNALAIVSTPSLTLSSSRSDSSDSRSKDGVSSRLAFSGITCCCRGSIANIGWGLGVGVVVVA